MWNIRNGESRNVHSPDEKPNKNLIYTGFYGMPNQPKLASESNSKQKQT